MQKIIVLLVFMVLASLSISVMAQESERCTAGEYWLVMDSAWDGVWIRQEHSRIFDGYWALRGMDDLTASVSVSFDGNQIFATRSDNQCRYTGEKVGQSVYGSSRCDSASELQWVATIVCGTQAIDWSTTATPYRAAKGQQFTLICPPSGAAFTIWGSGYYTDDSSICTAAVHDGFITLEDGGTVTIEILSGRESYRRSFRNGITSLPYGEWDSSFRIVSAEENSVPPIAWDDNVVQFRGMNDQVMQFNCLPQSNTSTIWGTDIYTDDSSVCGAAAHAGLIDESGGLVTLKILPGQDSYEGSTRNGITTLDYGTWDGSFSFVGVSFEIPSEDISGVWDTTYGEMVLENDGGVYDGGDGRVYFERIDARTFVGVWVEWDNSDYPACSENRYDSSYWGRLRFEFDETLNTFTGLWSYCGEKLTNTWDGTRREE